jgi:hypothetical protein
MGPSSTDRRPGAGAARHPGRDQSRRHVRADGPSLRRADQQILGSLVRRGHRPRARDARGRCPAAPVGDRDDEPGREAESRHRRPESGGVPGGLDDPREEDRAVSSRDRGVRGGDDVPRPVAGPRAGGAWLGEAPGYWRPRDRAGLSGRNRARRPAVRTPEPERAQRSFHVRGHAARVRGARPGDQCAPIAPPPPRGFFISSTSGSSRRKITPSNRKIVTNATIAACCWTFPNSEA